jgi:hydrogenase maturation protease
MPVRLILGYGNPLRSDDGFGWKAATVLEQELSEQDIKVMAAQQLTPELAEAVASSSRVLFLDASHDGPSGEIRMQPVRRDPNFQPGAISHQLSPSVLLELAYRYYGAEPDATLLTVTGENFELGENFSPVLQNAWKPCLARVLEWVRAL